MKLLSVKEVAQRLSVSSLTVIRLFDTGALKGVVLANGKHRLLRFRPETVEDFITKREDMTSR